MYCSRCGAPSEEGARYCAACGSTLPGAKRPKEESRSPRERLAALVGTNRRSRLITAATALAIVVAAVAFFALKPADEDSTIPRDAYTIEADQLCVQAKRDIASAERRSLADSSHPAAFAQSLVPIVISWRSEMNAVAVPSDRTAQAQALDAALREVEIEISALARVAGEGNRQETVERAQQVDQVTTRVEAAVSALGLSQCAQLTLGVSPAASG